jgi:hypothetical protein
MVRRVEAALPWVAAALGPAVLFAPMLVRGEAPFWGTALLQFVPWRTLALRDIFAGHLPLWNPWLGTGAPLLANYQSALLYPPNWLMALVGPAWGGGLLMMLHLIWAGVGMIVLARRLGLGRLSQMLAAASFSLSGALVVRGSFQTMVAVASWLPWLVVAADALGQAAREETTRRARGRAVLACAAILAMQWLAGHAQFAWYSFLVAAGWALVRAHAIGGWRAASRSLALLAAASLLALAISAVQLVPTAEYLLQSSRGGGLDPESALTYSLWPWRLLGWLMPGLFGNPAAGDYWGYGAFWEDALYIGTLPFLLALLGLIRGTLGRGPERGLARYLCAVFVLALVLALGRNTPIYPFLFRYVPTFSLFQGPARWSLLAVFSASLLAAFAAEGWRPLAGRALYWGRLGTAGAAAFAVSAWTLGPRLGGIEPSFIRSFALAGALMAVAGALALLRKPSPGLPWSVAVAGFVVLDLILAGQGLNPSAPLSLFEGTSQLARATGNEHRLFMPSDVEYDLKFGFFFRFDTFNPGLDWRLVREAGLPDTPLLDPIPSASNFDPLQPSRSVAFRDALEDLPSERQDRLLRLIDVGWRAVADPGRAAGVAYVPVPGAARARLLPNARWVETPAQALELVMSDGFEPEREVVLEGAPSPEVPEEASPGAAEIIADDNPNRVVLTADSQGGGWLVLSDAYYPGWRARVDGSPTRIYPADFLLRAVWVPAGEHEVVFDYRPASVQIGAFLSLVAGAFAAVAGARWRSA